MPSIHETAYPRLKAAITARDLAEVYRSMFGIRVKTGHSNTMALGQRVVWAVMVPVECPYLEHTARIS
jgi:hypothetical protein